MRERTAAFGFNLQLQKPDQIAELVRICTATWRCRLLESKSMRYRRSYLILQDAAFSPLAQCG